MRWVFTAPTDMQTPKRAAFVVAVLTVVLFPFLMFAICVVEENSDLPRKLLIVPEIFLFFVAVGVAFVASCVLRDSFDRWRQEDSPFALREHEHDPDDCETGTVPRCVNVAGVNSTDPRVDLDAECQFCLDPLSCDVSAAVGVAEDPGESVRVGFHVAPLMLCTSCRKAFHWKCLMQQFAHCTRHTLVAAMRCPNCRVPFIEK
jgi:hypothetical protein